MPFEDHPQFKDFVAYLRLKNLSERTIEEYRKVLRSLFNHIGLGEAAPALVTAEQLRSYLASLQQKGLAPKTITDRVIVIRRFFGFLLQEGYVTADPSRGLPYRKKGQHLPRVLSISELQQLLATFTDTTREGERDRIFFQLAYAGGLRISEVTHLRAENIDWNEGSLRVVGKGDKERRVYLKAATLQALKEYVEQFAIRDWLFPGRNGQAVTMRNMDMRFELYVEKAGLPKWVTPHCLRHSIAVHYLMGGAPLSFVQDLLGHANLGTTGIYTRLTDSMMKEITLRIPTALDSADTGNQARETKEERTEYHVDVEDWAQFLRDVLDWRNRHDR